MLCQVSYWDGTTATFAYNSGNPELLQLASVTTSGGETSSFAYDSDNRLADIRDALATDYLAAGGQAGTPAPCTVGTGPAVTPADTQVCYDSSGRVASVTQPAPTTGAARPGRTYTYAPASDGSGSTYVQIAGFTPNDATAGTVTGYAERTDYDTQGRIIRQTDSAGHVTTTVWANASPPVHSCATYCVGEDEPIVTASPDGEQTSTVYDQFGNVTDTYGPAPMGCFSGGWPTGATPVTPVTGYLPVANPQGTAGCGVSAVPHTHNGYDEGFTGLAATYWGNGQFAGAPTMHGTTLDSQPQPLAWCGTANSLCADWAAGSAPTRPGGVVPIPTDANGNWSLRLAGTITIPDNIGAYTFDGDTAVNILVSNSQPATVSIDGTPVVYDGPNIPCGCWHPGGGNNNWTDSPLSLSPGPHTIEVDFQGTTAQLSEFSVQFNYAIDKYEDFNNYAVIPDSMLGPAYDLKTSTTDADGDVTATSYSNATIGPEYDLPTTVTTGAGSSTPLTTTTTYQPPGAGSYLQKTSTMLPAGNTTNFESYTGTGGGTPVTAACGVTATTQQGGQLEQQTDPDPGNGQPLVKQFIYDAAGRQAGVRTGTNSDIGTEPWQCTTYDSRGRLASQSWPAANGSPARTVTYTYSVGGNPLVSSVSDPSGTITSTVDLLGRVTSYTDVWGQTTTTSYNQADQVTATSGPGGSYQLGYDPNSGQPTTTTVNGALLATASYDSAGQMIGVTYGNGTSAIMGYDAYGNHSVLTFKNPAGGVLTKDAVTRTLAGRESTETASTSGAPVIVNYTYDGASRLTQADDTQGGTLDSSYSYAASPSCPSQNAGENTNRTSVTIGSTTTSYCYNNADQLVSSTTGGTTSTNYAYNERGDQTTDNNNTYTWDSSDRAATATLTTRSGIITTYQSTTTSTYDAVNRLAQSAFQEVSPLPQTSTVHYSYAGYGDSPAAVLNASNSVLQQLVALPGGVTVAVQPSGNVWSYVNLQGDTTCTANASGSLISGPVTYDPWGNLNPGQTAPSNVTGVNTLGAYATSGKLTNTTTGTILLGARTTTPAEGRFLSVDPVFGGCANPYTYAFGDPLNHGDLTGQAVCQEASTTGEGTTCSASWGWTGISAACTIWVNPYKAASLAERLSTTWGQLGLDSGAGLFCWALTAALGAWELGPLAGFVCGVLASLSNTALVNDLNHAAQNNEYMDLTISVHVGAPTNGRVNVNYSPEPPGC
jgi:RHS repeat-associated protein